MKTLFILILFALSFSAMASEAASEKWCYDQALSEVRTLIAGDHQDLLIDQFKLTTLKLALVAKGNKDLTLEDYVHQRARALNSSAEALAELEVLYNRHGKPVKQQELFDSFEMARYWDSSLRLSNENAALFTELHRLSSESSPFDSRDTAILWLFETLSQELGERASADHNQGLASYHIARLLGGVGGDRAARFGDLVLKIEELERDFEVAAGELLGNLSAEWKLTCGEVLSLSCQGTSLLEGALIDLAREEKWLGDIREKILKLEFASEVEFLYPEIEEVDIHPNLKFDGLADLLIYDNYYLKYRDISRYQKELNALPSAEAIIAFHKDSGHKENYALVDKQEGVLYLVSPEGDVLEVQKLEGGGSGDMFEDGGAGIYQLEVAGTKILSLRDESGRGKRLGLSAAGARLESGSLVYILPTDPNHLFKVKNGELNFTTVQRRSNYTPYNYSPKGQEAVPTIFQIQDSSRRNSTSVEYVKTLATEKEKLMKLYGLDNDEYNELAKLAFGILGNESDYGRSFKYHIKEAIPLVVALLKGNGFDTSRNSRGLTQIKNVPDLIEKEYGTTKSDLKDPKHAAVATLGFLADALAELKVKARQNPAINSDNQFEYLHYIYMGKAREITERTATPERNIYLQQIKEAAAGLFIYQRKES